MQWHCGSKILDLTRPLVMGIVNVTPDSFSDGGEHASASQAIEHARRLLQEGADLVDIGGESTRPGAAPVSWQEELERVLPVVKALVRDGACVSVDTSSPQVMRAVIDAGVHMINDVRALSAAGAMEEVARSSVGVCLMHMQGTPKDMQQEPHYDNLLEQVKAFLLSRARACEAAGIDAGRIGLDYGFGFGKTVDQNFELLAHTADFAGLAYPLLVGLSRKSSLGAVTGRPVNERVSASVAGALIAAQKGAAVVRVHDVAATVDAFKIWFKTESILRGKYEP